MDERIARTIQNIKSFEALAQFEKNARNLNALDKEVGDAIHRRSADLGRALIAERTGLDLTVLSPAEEKIVQAVSEYVGVMKRKGKDATRTLLQLGNRGLLESAETAVAKSEPTQGFQTLADADLIELSYEKIILDHPEEFSERAQWYARRTLKLPNESEKPPAKSISSTQRWTETLLQWLKTQSASNGGILPRYTNGDAAAALGITDIQQFERVFGNIQSRIDFACYQAGLPPLGLAASYPFEMAWNQQNRDWAFPVEAMQVAARSRQWSGAEFDRLVRETKKLPGQAHLSWKKELAQDEAGVRRWAFGFDVGEVVGLEQADERSKRNPPWLRDELILVLDLYLRFPNSPPGKDSLEVAELSSLLGEIGRLQGRTKDETFRNANGVYMKMMNFRRFDPQYTDVGRVGLVRGNKLEEVVWNEFHTDPKALTAAVAAIRAKTIASRTQHAGGTKEVLSQIEVPYWVFVCNPKKWAIDEFLAAGRERDAWGVRPFDQKSFAPGQLGLVRVGVDRRSAKKRNGRPPLEPGIYALVEVESHAYPGTGANDEFWSPGAEREPGWPTVNIRYIRTYVANPPTIERLERERPNLDPKLLNGFQASSFPISRSDFLEIIAFLGEEIDDLLEPKAVDVTTNGLAAMHEKYKDASPEVKERVSKYIERGPIGALVKKANGFKCQVCDALGLNPLGFRKPSGEFYIEAHHVMPVAALKIGALAPSNVMTVCANHHRQIHYGGVGVEIRPTAFELTFSERTISIPRYDLGTSDASK